MNGDTHGSELPELTDEDVGILDSICKRASHSNRPPFKALFAAYDEVFAEQQIQPQHDGVVFRYILRVGENATAALRAGDQINYVSDLREILDAHGITVLDNDEDGVEEVTRSIDIPQQLAPKARPKDRRRVSFDDARLEETRISERSYTNDAETLTKEQLLRRPPVRGRPNGLDRRARSTSSQRNVQVQQPARNHFQQGSPSSYYSSEPDVLVNPTLLFQHSQTELELNAETFLATSTLRATRRWLHSWHDAALSSKERNAQAYAIAAAHDQRTLGRQALDQWRTALQTKQEANRHEAEMNLYERRATQQYHAHLKFVCFDHWRSHLYDVRATTRIARGHILRIRYFRRWKRIAADNATKARSILARKYLAAWRDRTARRLFVHEQATAHYEETLMKRLYWKWFWDFCSVRVEGWRDGNIQRRAVTHWTAHFHALVDLNVSADQHRISRLKRMAWQALSSRLQGCQNATTIAQAHHDRKLKSRYMPVLQAQARLAPIQKTLALKVKLDVQRKAFAVWHLRLNLSRQAVEVDRNRILQNTWTNWNDALRCRALSQRIDERVLVENLYKWVLQERLRLFQRALGGRLVKRCMVAMQQKLSTLLLDLEQRAAVFVQNQTRRRLAAGMRSLNIALRGREDAERAALEFANSRALPNVLEAWKDKTDHARRLAKWAADARYYCLCSAALKTWRERTTQHKHERRRQAYIHVRGRRKVQLVGTCLARLREKCAEVRSMAAEADERLLAKNEYTVAMTLHTWRERTHQLREQDLQAYSIDRQKLLSSALGVLLLRQEEFTRQQDLALAFRHEANLTLLASALKRLQWATFTARRQVESADALRARIRDQHLRQMLRHWAGKSLALRTSRFQPPPDTDAEPESPSLRPASRAASRSGFASPSRAVDSSANPGTPAYLHTPSRTSRRAAARFKPIPTPAPYTPLAFDTGYLTTTPAPLNPIADSSPPFAGGGLGTEALTPQVTPFARKLRAGGFGAPPASVRGPGRGVRMEDLRTSMLGRSVLGTGKSVRFAAPDGGRGGQVDS